jgi:glycosyltransferase involved in cell wall biosynthesis
MVSDNLPALVEKTYAVMRKIRVLRIINRFNLGGPTYNATFLTAFLGDQFETKLIGGKHEEHEGASTFILDKYKVNYEIIDELQRNINWSQDKLALKKIRAIIKEYKPDIVHTHASKSGFIGRLAAHRENVPVIVHTFHGHVFHSYFGYAKTAIYKNLERWMANKSDAVIMISPKQKVEIVEKFKIVQQEKAIIIPLGFDLSKFRENQEALKLDFREKYDIKEDELAIGIIGRLAPIKNHDLLIEAAVLIAKSSSQKIRVLVIGDGQLGDSIKAKCFKFNKEIGFELFVFTSWIKNIEFALAGLDIVALSSLNEGTPVSLIEAQAAGVPVISTNVGGVRDILAEDKTGFVVDGFKVEDYAQKLKILVESKEIRENMSQNGWNHVREEFSYTRLCSDVVNLYNELLKKKGVEC